MALKWRSNRVQIAFNLVPSVSLVSANLHQHVTLGHASQQRVRGLSHLKVHGAILDLKNHIRVEGAVERLEGIVGLP